MGGRTKAPIELPIPYKEEIWYSAIARYKGYLKLNVRQLLLKLYGNTACCSVVDLPVRILEVLRQSRLAGYIDAETVITDHTLFPYFTAFVGSRRRQQVKHEMLNGDGGQGYTCFYLFDRGSRFHDRLFYCPMCVSHDSDVRGEPFWHRIHQVPGVVLCLEHGVPLTHKCPTCESPFFLSDHNYISLSETCISGHSLTYPAGPRRQGPLQERFNEYAQDVDTLLQYRPSFEPRELLESYVERLKTLNLATPRGNIRVRQLAESLVEFYGNEYLAMMNCGIDIKSSDNWYLNLLRKHEETVHPLKHLLLIRFLFGSLQDLLKAGNGSFRPFGTGPWPCLNRASDHFGQPMAQLVSLKKHKSQKPLGVFKCECGFIYERLGPDDTDKDKFNYNYILRYGPIWEAKLGELAFNLHMREGKIAEFLCVSQPTIHTQITKIKNGQKIDVPNMWDDAYFGKIRQEFRHVITNLVDKGIYTSRSQIERNAKKECAWLYEWDREWVEQVFPPAKSRALNLTC